MRLSIVIPTLDEAHSLPATLPRAVAQADEVWVADGGSRDSTATLAASLGARVVCGPPGRGGQLNRGAAAAQGDVLLFLHADTLLPPDAAAQVRQAIATGAVGGGFALRFDADTPLYRFAGRMITLRTRLIRCPFGDQAQFATRRAFADLGGFRDWPVLEDVDFFRRLKRRGPTRLIPAPVVTSARRYRRQGFGRTVAGNWLIFALYLAGVPPARLARLYRHVR